MFNLLVHHITISLKRLSQVCFIYVFPVEVYVLYQSTCRLCATNISIVDLITLFFTEK